MHYTDGSSQSFNLNMADWYANSPGGRQPAPDHHVELELPEQPARRAPGEHVLRLGAAAARASGVVGHAARAEQRRRDHGHAHLRDGDRQPAPPTTGAPYSSLAAAYDNVGISDNSDPRAADFDGTGESFSAQALAAGTPTPLTAGGQATIGGTTFTWPTAVGTPDNVIADGQIIDLSGSGTDLGFLGAGAFGAASGTGTITYTDGSTQSYSLGMADWYNNAAGGGRRGRHHHVELELRPAARRSSTR